MSAVGSLWRAHWKKLLILPPLLGAVALLALLIQGREPPQRNELGEEARHVRTIEVPRLTVIPRAVGFGPVKPGRAWDAVAEVSGRVVEVHPDLKRGAILPAGAELVRLDATEYELAVSQFDAQLAELADRESNTRASLAIERRNAELAAADLQRKKELLSRGSASRQSVDAAEQAQLASQQAVQSLKNELTLIPAQRRLLQAQRDNAALDLARTTIRAPFDIRLAEVNVETSQYAQKGELLAIGDGLEVAEVEAQVPLDRMFTLIAPDRRPLPEVGQLGAALPELLGVSPTVHLRLGQHDLAWRARLARIADTVDPQTRTIGVIVAVDDPYRSAIPGVRPPLTKGMFVEVELAGRPRPDRVAVPRAALHEGHVYLIDRDDRLEKRPVSVAFQQGGLAVLDEGLEGGETLIVTDLVPAVAGMLLIGEADPEALAALKAEAGGKAVDPKAWAPAAGGTTSR
ncbi:efflux RND transporter periplasmic adaptor subunit [Roseospirillum parvum]|uniref:RND family efflux transporter, MFP subunit n=1 Tax=Roseospirillum parvum TaxID=83401 RepID=A0A1G8CYM5_9PROT|nr:efflux RND transporter periplasmic adaptor subunit [Roseospirillum parvum]SDH50595.1 RND family efflux transporter, MFP subunit [Roseospirillum parvum]